MTPSLCVYETKLSLTVLTWGGVRVFAFSGLRNVLSVYCLSNEKELFLQKKTMFRRKHEGIPKKILAA